MSESTGGEGQKLQISHVDGKAISIDWHDQKKTASNRESMGSKKQIFGEAPKSNTPLYQIMQ